MSDHSNETVIANGTDFDGRITSECGIKLSGRLKGEVSAPSLLVCETGVVDGIVQVLELKSSGELSGEIEAETIELSGKVSDNTVIRANTLEVRLNQPNGMQVTFGNCALQVGNSTKRTKGSKHLDASQSGVRDAHQPVGAASSDKVTGI